MYNFESDSSLIIYVSRRNPQTTPWSFIFEYITRSAPAKARPSGRAARAARAAPPAARAPHGARLTAYLL